MHYVTREKNLIDLGDDPMENLYRAAYRGDQQALEELLQSDATILDNIPDRETPLHISALLGHVGFTNDLLNHDLRLATRADSSGRTALHLASAEGHLQIVQRLLVNNQSCLVRDEEGRIPLHYAVMRGRTNVVQELIRTRPESLRPHDEDRTTVFHLCVTYNRFKTLETLVNLDYATANITGRAPRSQIFLLPNRDGDTILHLAAMLKRVQVLSYLLSIPEIREIVKLRNNMGLTASDILEESPNDFTICAIQHMLTNAEREDHPRPPQNDGHDIIQMFIYIGNFVMTIFRWIGYWSKREDKWFKEMRGTLSLVSTVITTITFEGLINAPGGFIQQGLIQNSTTSDKMPNFTSSYNLLNCSFDSDSKKCCPGEAMASHVQLAGFKNYLFFVTISFFSSLCVTLLLVSGIFPMKNKAVIWVASIGMCITLTCLAAAYISAIHIINPNYLLEDKLGSFFKRKEDKLLLNIDKISYTVWSRLLELIVVLITLRFFIWAIKKCVKIFKKSRSWERVNNGRCPRFLCALFRGLVILVASVVLSAQLFVVYLVFSSLEY